MGDKPKNKYVAFHGGNEAAVQVYRDLKRLAHEKDLFIWQVIRDGLEALVEREAVEKVEYSSTIEAYMRLPSKGQNETKEPVIVKSIDGSLYFKGAVAHNHNFYLSSDKTEAMVFANHDQAAAFLRRCGHEISNWIIEPS